MNNNVICDSEIAYSHIAASLNSSYNRKYVSLYLFSSVGCDDNDDIQHRCVRVCL